MTEPIRKHLVLFMISSFLFWTALYVYVPILAPYGRHLGGSMTVVGLIIASYGLMQLLFRIPLGVWSDRIGRRKPFLVAGLLLLAASGIGLALSPTPEWMILARALGGLAACSWVIWAITYAGYFDSSRTTTAMSHLAVNAALGQLVSTYGGGWIADAYGWQMPFYVGAGLALLSILFLLPLPDTAVAESGKITLRRIKAIGASGTLLFVSSIAAAGQFVNFVTIYGFTPVYATQIGATNVQQGTLILVGMACQMVSSYIGGSWCAYRFGNRGTILVAFLVTGIGSLLIPYSETLAQLYMAQAIGGFGRGLMQPILMALAVQSVPQGERGTAMGIFQAVYAIGMFSGPALGGVLGDWFGLGGLFVFTAVLCVASAGVIGMKKLEA
ncbi:MAG: MFS transporter [Candidatus Latescibacteria bacterium]|nr:MFS transporter [Candidatus Latescibacterota bacterium]